MKTTLFFIFGLFVSTLTGQIKYENSLAETFAKAQKEGKYVFIKYFSNNCSHCKELQEVLEIESVYSLYNSKFVCYKVDIENLEDVDDAFFKKNQLFVDVVPMLFFFDSNKNFLHYYQPKTDEASLIRAVGNVFDEKERTIYLPINYNNGDREVVNLKMYSKYAQLQRKDSLVDVLADEIFKHFPKNLLISSNSIVSVAKYVKSINNGLFQYWMDNYSGLDTVVPQFKMEDKEKVFKDVLSASINREKHTWNLDQIQRAKKYIKITKLVVNENSLLWQEESKILFEQGKENEALQIGKSIFEDKDIDIYTKLYAFKVFLKKVKKSQSFDEIEQSLMHLIAQNTDVEIKAQLKCHLVLLYKLSASPKFKQAEIEVQKFIAENNLKSDMLASVVEN